MTTRSFVETAVISQSNSDCELLLDAIGHECSGFSVQFWAHFLIRTLGFCRRLPYSIRPRTCTTARRNLAKSISFINGYLNSGLFIYQRSKRRGVFESISLLPVLFGGFCAYAARFLSGDPPFGLAFFHKWNTSTTNYYKMKNHKVF